MPRTSLVLALFLCTVAGVAAQDAIRPAILNVTMSGSGDQLTISGKGFGSAPLVTIDGQPATVITATDTEVSVVTPAVLLTTTGTFRLTVVDSVRQVGEAFVVASRSGPVVGLTSVRNVTSSGAISTVQPGVTSAAASSGGTAEISAIENPGSPYTTALGYQALAANTGLSNTAVGYQTLLVNTTGQNNTASGAGALVRNTTGAYNTATGSSALAFNSTGSFNTAHGSGALIANGDGSNNTAVGASALYNNLAGSQNTAVGAGALRAFSSASLNTALGADALSTNYTGTYNVASGVSSLFSNTSGAYNVASGVNSLYLNTSGDTNTAIGSASLYDNTTGQSNTALGYHAGYAATIGAHNLFLGAEVIGTPADTNTIRVGRPYTGLIGQNQTFIAGIRGTAVSGGLPVIIDAAGKLGTAGGSTALSVLDTTNTQPYQLRLGYATSGADYGIGRNPSDGVLDFTATQTTYSGFRFNTPNAGTALAIANNGVVSIMDRNNTQPYQLRLGYLNGVYDYALGRNPNDGYLNFAASQGTYSGYRFSTPNAGAVLTIANNGNVGMGVTAPTQPIQLASGAYVSAGGVWTNASSRTLKDRITPLSTAEAIQTVSDLSPVTFVYKAAPSEAHVGFIAEDVPDLVATGDRRSLATMDLLAVVTKVVQDQQRQLQDQQERLREQDATVAELRARLARLETLLAREP